MEFNYINALLKKEVSRTPVWIMRQAGRYLPEYRNTRKRAGSFLKLCKSSDMACEVTLQPLDRFDLDAAILFSDILTIPDAMGLGLYFVEGEGPKFERPLSTIADIKKLAKPDVASELAYVSDAVSKIKKNLKNKLPLIGFSGSPWTLATYMIEGGTSKTFSKAKGLMFENPKYMHLLLDLISDTIIDYINNQIASGADSIMIFDTWGGLLSKHNYQKFSLNYMEKIIQGMNRKYENKTIPVTIFTKGGGAWLEEMANIGCDALGLDWTVELRSARERVGDKVALQGNLDPCALYANKDNLVAEIKKIMQQFDGNTGHVFNLGHGINPDVNPDNVKILVDTVHEYSQK